MHLTHWIFIICTIAYSEAWPCNLCAEHLQGGCLTDKIPLWSSFGNGETVGISQKAVKISPFSEIMGMHNEIVTKVQILQEGTIKRYNFLLIQPVPSSFYVDQYELQRLTLGDVKPVFKNNIDVELPAYMSRDEKILFYFNSSLARLHETQFSIPWHSRYHKCSHDDSVFHVNATIPPPTLYTSCMSTDECEFKLVSAPQNSICHVYPDALQAPCSPRRDAFCTWIPVTHGTGDVSVRIPVGHCEHGWFVTAATLLSTLIGTITLGHCSVKYGQSKH